MRTLLLAAVPLCLVLGCTSDKTSAPRPVPAPNPTAAPATIVFAANGAHREVYAVPEDGSRPAARLSTDGVDGVVAGVLADKRVLVASLGKGNSLTELALVSLDGATRSPLGALPEGRYAKASRALGDGPVAAIEVARLDAPGTADVFALGGAAPVVIATNARLISVASGRIAYVTNGKLKSARADGSDERGLGGTSGKDDVVDARADRILLTTHAEGPGDVRLAHIDGSAPIDVGAAFFDERAIGFSGARVLFTRGAPGERAILSVGLDGAGEITVADAALDAEALMHGAFAEAVTTPWIDARTTHPLDRGVLFTSKSGALYLGVPGGGAPTLLDAAASAHVRDARLDGEHAFYVVGSALRRARLDGRGTATLCDEPAWQPFFSAVTTSATSESRVVFYRTLAGQLEGGKLFSVKLDGTDRKPVGVDVRDPDGKPHGEAPEDQDFEAITPQGRVLLEAEFEGVESHLLLGAGGIDAQRITAHTKVKLAALVP
jgi:hypothetical protein